MDRPVGVGLDFVLFNVEGFTQNVEDVSLDAVTNWDGDRSTGVLYGGATNQAVGGLQGNCTNEVVTQVLGGLERDLTGLACEGDLTGQCVVDRWDRVGRELDVHDRTDHASDAAGCARRRGRCRFGNLSSHVSHFAVIAGVVFG